MNLNRDLEFEWIWNRSAIDAASSIATLDSLNEENSERVARERARHGWDYPKRQVRDARRFALCHAITVLHTELRDARDRVARECESWFDASAFDIEWEWHSTPQLWAAYRHGYDGAEDSHCKVGYGKTKQAAASDLIEKETE